MKPISPQRRSQRLRVVAGVLTFVVLIAVVDRLTDADSVALPGIWGFLALIGYLIVMFLAAVYIGDAISERFERRRRES